MITINQYLDNILFDFKRYVDSGVELCDLKDVHFDAGRVPDYSNIHIQELICKGWFLPPNTYDCGSFVVNGTAVIGKESKYLNNS